MRRRYPWAWLLAALFLCGPPGCSSRSPNTTGMRRNNPPPDPLLLSKTPVQAKYGTTSDVSPYPEPSPPTMPAGAWVTSPSDRSHLAGGDSPPTPFRWTSDRRDVKPGKAKFRSLEGRLEKAGDQWVLKTDAEPAMVRLEGHPRLDLFESGDVIQVEGSLVKNRSNTGWTPHPLFVVERVRLLRRGS